jgi:hypothetical protein
VKRRGLLIPCLLLIAMMLVLCLATLSRQPYLYRAGRAGLNAAQARSLAETGLEEFRARWNHDQDFPPRSSGTSKRFTYSEEVLDPVSSQRLGRYRITVDETWMDPPYQLLKLECRGETGSAQEPESGYTIEAKLDLCPDSRPGRPRSFLGEWMEWRELPDL